MRIVTYRPPELKIYERESKQFFKIMGIYFITYNKTKERDPLTSA